MAAIQDETRVALVTGATRGIGQAIADSLAAAGHTVIGTATSDTGAATIAERLEPSGGTGLRLDVASSDSVSEVLASITERFGADNMTRLYELLGELIECMEEDDLLPPR